MIINSAILQGSAPSLAACPVSELPEFAFIGRSNVGKSSLINMLVRRKDLARVSSTPGKTRLINFFAINNHWTLVDLPGYGYAKVATSERAKFSSFVADSLQNRPNLQGTFVLIDARLTPQQIDLDFLHWMVNAGVPFILVFTKADKLSTTAAQQNIDAFMQCVEAISEEPPPMLLSSAKKGQGRPEILNLISTALAEDPEDFGETVA